MAAVNHPDEKLFVAFARVAGQRMHEHNALNLVNTTRVLFRALARAAEERMSEFKKEFASMAWEFATMNRPDERLSTALAQAARQRMLKSPRSKRSLVDLGRPRARKN